MTQFTIPTLLKLTYYDFCNILFYWFSRDSYCFPLILICIFFLLLYLTFDIKRSGSWPLSFSLLLWSVVWHSFSEHSTCVYWVPDTVVGTGDMTMNKTDSILAFVKLMFFREFLFSFMIDFLLYSYFQNFIYLYILYILISLWDMTKWMSFWPRSLRMCNIEFAIPVPYHLCS